MTPQQKLQALINKAIEGGWDTTHFSTLKADYKHPDESEFHDLLGDWHDISPFDIIFNHDFAKALWNTPRMWEGPITELCFETRDGLSEWQYHLQQMVISDDPISYAYQSVFGDET